MAHTVTIALLFLVHAITSQQCDSDMTRLESYARSQSVGYRPDGRCYFHVANFLDATGFGGINRYGFDDAIPSAYWVEARQFAEYLNQGNNAANLCLRNDQAKYNNNPYNAPAGSIVVV